MVKSSFFWLLYLCRGATVHLGGGTSHIDKILYLERKLSIFSISRWRISLSCHKKFEISTSQSPLESWDLFSKFLFLFSKLEKIADFSIIFCKNSCSLLEPENRSRHFSFLFSVSLFGISSTPVSKAFHWEKVDPVGGVVKCHICCTDIPDICHICDIFQLFIWWIYDTNVFASFPHFHLTSSIQRYSIHPRHISSQIPQIWVFKTDRQTKDFLFFFVWLKETWLLLC